MTDKKLKELKEFEVEFSDLKPRLERLRQSLVEQLTEIITANNVSLGFPIQSRVKSFNSISNKVENGRFNLKNSVTELQDLVGIRIILLFTKDVEKICKIIDQNLVVKKKYNTGERLEDNQFGYTSEHYIVKIPESWLSVPTLKDLDVSNIEIQIRTLSQHIWAEASNHFQYKQEDNIPRQIKRSIGRISALLETIDLEFERLNQQRDIYKDDSLAKFQDDEIMNVDLLAKILDDKLPENNKIKYQEDYSELLSELLHFKISTISDLTNIINEYLDFALLEDRKMVEEVKADEDSSFEDMERASKGVFFTHIGLVRTMLGEKLGEKYKKLVTPFLYD